MPFLAAVADGAAYVCFVEVSSCGVDVAVAEGQCCAYSIVSFIADGNHEYAEADGRDDDAVI